jgi:mannose-6-phosphate isomerase-like protein (cupin superfamily)
MRMLLSLLLLITSVAYAQEPKKVFYYAKPTPRPAYSPPMKPVTRLADLKAKNQGKSTWREPVINDGNSISFMNQEPVGTKHERQLYPDSAAWFIVLEGRIRFEVEKRDGGFEVINASKGSYVFAPERLLHSFEIVGSEPAIYYAVTAGPSSTPVYEKRPTETPKGTEYIPVTLSTGPNPLDVYNEGHLEGDGGKPWPYHLNVYELQKQNSSKKGFTQEAMRANRARGNFICGYRPATFPTDSGNRGHLHTDTAESWVIMLGELRWVFDGDEKNAVVARQGDIIYAVPGTFHSPQFWGKDGLNCRLTNSTMTSLNHLYDAPK